MQKENIDPNILGAGSYGSVRKEGNVAIKKFDRLGHLIQEIVSGYYLRNSKYIVTMYSFNLDTLEISMQLCDSSLRKLLNSKEHFNRWNILKDILYGFCELHERNLLHGDIKPGNILINYKDDEPTAIIADLGFISISQYSKASRCARAYRELNVRQYYGHDIYSLAVLMLELLSGYKVRRQLKYSTLQRRIRKHLKGIKCPTGHDIVSTVLRMTSIDYKERPRAKELLKLFFNESHNISNKNNSTRNLIEDDFKIDYSNDSKALIMKKLSKKYKISRAKRGYKILKLLTPYEDEIYAVAMCVILISLFSRRSYGEDNSIPYSIKLKYAIEDLLSNEAVIDSLLLE